MLIDPSNHFICLLIDDFRDGRGTTTQSCLASPFKQSKAKFGVTNCNKKIILGQKIKANRKIIMGRREYLLFNLSNTKTRNKRKNLTKIILGNQINKAKQQLYEYAQKIIKKSS